jgi:aldose 1-epimerase
MALTGQQYRIIAGGHEATVVEVGAGLRSYTVDGAPVTVGYGEDVLPPKGCGSVLVPWPNRVRGGRYTFDGLQQRLALTEPALGNAIHGLGRWARWSLIEQQPSLVSLGIDLVPQSGWPFEARVEVTYALHPVTGLGVSATAVNTGQRRAPFGAGFHPYLATRGKGIGEMRLTVPARERLLVDEAQVPVGVQSVSGSPYDLRRGRRLHDLRLDDAFTALSYDHGRAAVQLRTRSGGARVWFDQAFRFVQIYTLDELTDGQPGIAVEPMTCAPNAFNSGDGLVVLEPGDRWDGSWGIQPV